MTRKSCAVGMRNAILRNYLKKQLVSLSVYRRMFLSKSSFKHLIFTLLKQLNTNLQGIFIHSSHTAVCSDLYDQSLPRVKYHLICEYSEGKKADYFVVFDHLHRKFVDCIITLLFCMKFFAYCGFPNVFIDVVSPNS